MGSAQASSLLTVAAAGHVDFPRVVITNPKSIEPHTSFELECNVSSQVQPVFVTWYQSNQAVDLMKQKYRTSWSNINESNLTDFYFYYVQFARITFIGQDQFNMLRIE